MRLTIFQLISLLVLVFPLQMLAQDLPLPTNIQSPNAATLGRYGDIPVSYYTGTPNISIPLYNLNDYGIPLSISMSYDGSGVKVNNMPGWVGQNWSLQAGGIITRTTKGKSTDEGAYATTAGGFLSFMHPTPRDILDDPDWESESFFHYLQTVSGNLDTEPDIFTFNFMGHTGKFFLDVDGEWKVSSSSNLKITIDPTENQYPFNEETVPFNYQQQITTPEYAAHKSIYKITITDDSGNRYVFGNTDNSIEYSVPFMGQTYRQWEANSWYLTQVYDRFDNLVYSFDYERDNYLAQFYLYERSEGWGTGDNSPGFDVSTCTTDISQFGSTINNGLYNGDLISPVYLTKIETVKGDINFSRTTSYAKSYKEDTYLSSYLSYIIQGNQYNFFYLYPYANMDDVFSKLNSRKLISISGLKKNIVFNYNDIFGNIDNDRLFLMDLAIDDKEYRFEYDNLDLLPNFLSKAVDHWGYYRGSYNFYPSGTASGSNNFNSYYNARTVSPTHSKMGSLVKITYPTKGWTNFDWESNSYSSYVSDDKSALISETNTNTGGLRIKRIRNNDNKGNEIIKTYKYVKNYALNQSSTLSSGILERKPKYYWQNFSFVSHQNNAYVLDEDLFSTIPSIPLSNESGTHIGYSEVIEILPNNGYTVYRFTSNENSSYRDEYNAYSLNPDLTPYGVYNDKSLLRGQLNEVEIRDKNNLRKRKTVNNFSFNNSLFVRGVNISARSCNNSGGVGYGFIKGSAYKRYFFDHNLIKETSFEYDDVGNFIKNETEYDWAYYPDLSTTKGSQFLQSRKIQSYSSLGNSDQEYLEEFYKYNFEESNAINDALISENHFALMQTDVYENNSKISSTKIEYDYFGPDILPKQLSKARGYNTHEVLRIIDKYNSNTRELETYHTKDGIYTYILNVDNYPVIQLEGKELTASQESYLYNTIGNYIEDQVDTIGWNGARNLIIEKQQQARTFFGNHMLTSYTYNPNVGVSSITDPRGFTFYYNYDSNERLINIKDEDGNVLEQLIYNLKSE